MNVAVGVRLGAYALMGRLADDTWLARDDEGGEVLVRVVAADDPGARLAALVRLTEVRSPYVVAVLDAGRLADQVWVATALPVGRGLPDVVSEEGWTTVSALDVVRQAALGIATVHTQGMTHGGLHPGVVHVADDGAVQVDGFGVPAAGWAAYDHTAPERYAGIPPGPAGDVYSLGCLLWTGLTGRPPYDAPTPYDVVRAHVDADPPQLTDSSPTARRVNAVLARALAKRTAARHPSAVELAADLAEALVVATADPVADRALDRPAGAAARAEAVSRWSAPSDLPPARTPRRRWRTAGIVLTGLVVAALAALGMRLALGGSDLAGPSTQATCWDGSRAATASRCPVPSGRAGLAHVFPSLDGACEPAPVQAVVKTEVFLCPYDGYLVRYSAWRPDADRDAYYDEANPGAERSRWRRAGVDLGRQWISFDERPREDLRYQWSATYADQPFSVSVEGVTEADRATGMGRVQALAPDQVAGP